MVWHFCQAQDAEKLKLLNKCILRFIFRDWNCDSLLKRGDTLSLAIKRVSNVMMCIFKSMNFTNYPAYLKELFRFRSSDYSLRGTNVLVLPKSKTTTYGHNSVSYAAARYWNSLPDSFRRITSAKEFGHSLFKLDVCYFYQCLFLCKYLVSLCNILNCKYAFK